MKSTVTNDMISLETNRLQQSLTSIKIISTLESDLELNAIYTNQSKAFDSFNQLILFRKLETLGVVDVYLR